MTDRTPYDDPPDCETCAAVCCSLEVLLMEGDAPPHRFVDTAPWGSAILRRGEDGLCAALDRTTRRCTIYDRRPRLCREYPAGEGDCLTMRRPRP